jgi:hypothetical protein
MTKSKNPTEQISFEETEWLKHVAANDPPEPAAPFGGVYTNEEALIAELKQHASIALLNNQVRAIIEKGDDFSMVSAKAAGEWFAGFQLEVQTPRGPKLVPGMGRYLKHVDCLRFTEISADPRVPRREGKVYSTWRGFSRKPRRGAWALMRRHIRDFVCAGNDEHFVWLMCWMAQILQEPHLKLGTAVVLRGPKGCGKTSVGYFLREIIGRRHARKVSQPSHVTGKFNLHLRDCFFLLVEEGVWGGNKQADGIMKDLITGETLMVEGKFVSAEEADNFTRLMITSNEGWVVPATSAERRYYVLDCLDPFPGLAPDHPARKAYFDALYAEAANGGLEAMMWELMEECDISRVNLRKPPITEALKDQVQETLSDEERWLQTALIQGAFTARNGESIDTTEWKLDKDLEVPTATLVNSYRDHIKTFSGSAPGTGKVLKFLKKWGTLTPKRLTVVAKRVHGYLLAPRKDWQEKFSQETHYTFDVYEE